MWGGHESRDCSITNPNNSGSVVIIASRGVFHRDLGLRRRYMHAGRTLVHDAFGLSPGSPRTQPPRDANKCC